jgi:hypothetical protein
MLQTVKLLFLCAGSCNITTCMHCQVYRKKYSRDVTVGEKIWNFESNITGMRALCHFGCYKWVCSSSLKGLVDYLCSKAFVTY